MSEGRTRRPQPHVDDLPFFRTSSYSGGGNCVEVGAIPGGGAIMRDTKDPARIVNVALNPGQWDQLLMTIKSGALELP